jgi:serine/threonine-protein kinase
LETESDSIRAQRADDMTRLRIRLIPWTCATAIALLSSTAVHAEPTSADKATAEVLFIAGKKLMAESNYEEACKKFEESQRLDAGVGTLMYLSDCYEKSSRTASAWATWREAAAAARTAGQADRETTARERAAALEPKLSMLSIVVPDASRVEGLVVKRDGTVLSEAVWTVASPVDPGIHVVEAPAPGKKPWRAEVNVRKHAAKSSVSIPVLDDDTPGAVIPPRVAVPPEPTEPARAGPGSGAAGAADAGIAPPSSSAQKTWGFVIGGLGLAGLGAGTFFALTTQQQLDDRDKVCPSEQNCTQDEIDDNDRITKDAKNNAMAANIGFIGGGAALVGGIILIATAPKAKPNPPAAGDIRVAPMVGAYHGVWIEGAW